MRPASSHHASPQKNSIAITFDDGYIDNFAVAKPLLEQYWIFIQQLFTGNLGTSYSFQAPAMQVVFERMPYTLS